MHRFRRSKQSLTVEKEGMDHLDLDVNKGLVSSTPDLSTSGMPEKKGKKKKKKHFRVFHRNHKDRNKSELDNRLTDSLPAGHTGNGHGLLPGTQAHLSLDSTWDHGSWRQLDPDMKGFSANSSKSSLSVETDEELVESLVYPQGKDSFRASSVSPVSLH